jgi:hypothetical protein
MYVMYDGPTLSPFLVDVQTVCKQNAAAPLLHDGLYARRQITEYGGCQHDAPVGGWHDAVGPSGGSSYIQCVIGRYSRSTKLAGHRVGHRTIVVNRTQLWQLTLSVPCLATDCE